MKAERVVIDTNAVDPDDNRFLEVLIADNGDLLNTGDSVLLKLHPYEGRSIMTPTDFLADRQWAPVVSSIRRR